MRSRTKRLFQRTEHLSAAWHTTTAQLSSIIRPSSRYLPHTGVLPDAVSYYRRRNYTLFHGEYFPASKLVVHSAASGSGRTDQLLPEYPTGRTLVRGSAR